MLSLPADPMHRGLPLTIAQRSLVVQRLMSSHDVPVAAGVVPATQVPVLVQTSPKVHGFWSHSRAPADGLPAAHEVTTVPVESVPIATQ